MIIGFLLLRPRGLGSFLLLFWFSFWYVVHVTAKTVHFAPYLPSLVSRHFITSVTFKHHDLPNTYFKVTTQARQTSVTMSRRTADAPGDGLDTTALQNPLQGQSSQQQQ